MRAVRHVFATALIAIASAGDGVCQEMFDQQPHWITRPSGKDFANFYPPAALAQHVTGEVQLDCTVALDTTARCAALSETPTGWGFADAAVAISRAFRLRPAYQNGLPVEGGRYRVRLPFRTVREREPPEEYRSLFARLPTTELIDLPDWEEAPNYAAVMLAYPVRAARDGAIGTVLLSCSVTEERRIQCTMVREYPGGYGFGEAALSLIPQFRVADHDTEFIERHSRGRFLLPITLGATPTEVPTYASRDGLGANVLPPVSPRILAQFYPPNGGGSNGEAVLRCNSALTCEVDYESPVGHGFGAAALQTMTIVPADRAHYLPGVFGEPFYIPFRFEPPRIAE